MTIAVTFDGTTIYSRAPIRKKLLGTYVYEWQFDCITDSSANITALAGKTGHCTVTTLLSGKVSVQTTGTSGTLTIVTTSGGSESYADCAIRDPITVQEVPGTVGLWWTYQINIVRDTA